ncbi:MAG: class I SAM-dependent methyltransferase [Rhodospirillaceae bacterium]
MRHISNHRMVLETLAEHRLVGARVVDVGCGDGRLARSLVEHGAASAVGIECSPRQLAKARALPAMDGVTVVEGVGQALPLADGTADIAVFFNSLHHIPAANMATALGEAARVLVPGGLVYACEPIAEGAFYDLCRPVDDEAEVRRLAQEALHSAAGLGLTVEREEVYCHPVRMADFETFRDRLVSANAERDEAFGRLSTELRASFELLAGRDPTGAYTFDQPARMTLLRRVLNR